MTRPCSRVAMMSLMVFAAVLMPSSRPEQLAASTHASQGARPAFASPGRVEGSDVAIQVTAGMTGLIEEILVRDGSEVTAGQVLARIDCNELIAELALRRAEATAARAHADLVAKGARTEQIAIAAAELRLADAQHQESLRARRRFQSLLEASAASPQRMAEAERDERVAAARRDAAREALEMLRAGPRVEELAEAKARADAAQHSVGVAIARVARCDVRSPIAGIVLRKLVSAGELVSTTVPRPIAILADLSRLRVRAEVDEEDVPLVRLGQPVTIVTARTNGVRLNGRVIEVGRQMGRRQILSNDPAERSDREVLDVVIEIEQAAVKSLSTALPIGLRVSVLFHSSSGPR